MREIIQNGNATLRAVAQEIPIKDISSAQVRTLIADMKKLLAKEKYGVALAAPQVDEPVRLFIVAEDIFKKRAPSTRARNAESNSELPTSDQKLPTVQSVYINPVLTKISRGKKEKHEGCLSVRGKWGMVPRAEKATIEAYDEHGKKFTRGASGLLAHIFQHEMDHLDGILYIDKAKELFDEKSDE